MDAEFSYYKMPLVAMSFIIISTCRIKVNILMSFNFKELQVIKMVAKYNHIMRDKMYTSF